MDYSRIYNEIIHDPRNNLLQLGFETHHILPRSIGGTDEQDNLVKLTYRRHFIAHWLLTKMYTGRAKSAMHLAFHLMMNRNKSFLKLHGNEFRLNSKSYELNRIEWKKAMIDKNPFKGGDVTRKVWTGRKHKLASRIAMSKSQSGKKLSDKTKQLIGEKSKKAWQNDESRLKRGEKQRDAWKDPERRKKHSERLKTRKRQPWSPEQRKACSERQKGKKLGPRTCMKCGQKGHIQKFCKIID